MPDLSYYIAALLPSGTPRWGSGAVGTAAQVTYSFLSAAPDYADADDQRGFAALNENQRSAVRQALALWAAVANITFTEVTDSAASQIRIGTNNQQGESSGWAYYPGSGSGGDVYFANDQSAMTNPSVPGSFGFSTIVHEIGHALGLKHPGNYNAGGGGTEGPHLPSAEDTEQYSAMSYNSAAGVTAASQSPQLYDIAAVQYLYGANTSYAAGNNTYTYNNTSSGFLSTVWDGGGTDTFDCSVQSLDCSISLAAGSFSSIGVANTYDSSRASNNVAIAYGATIENAIGGSGADVITGNDAGNTLTGGSGNDTLIGGSGSDVAVYLNTYGAYQISAASSGSLTVRAASGVDGADTLTGIEILRFSDRDVWVDSLFSNAVTTSDSFYAPYAYAAMNADLYAAYGLSVTGLEQHYISHGRGEGRLSSGFNPYAYAAMNSDLFSAFGGDAAQLIQHYISHGRSEGRTATGFDPYAYAANNSDLFAAFGTNISQLVQHYISSGRSEGRIVSGFDPYAYAAMNGDLFAAFGTSISQLTQHYVSYGRSEGRVASGFSVEGYAVNNSDVFNAVNGDYNGLVSHYVNYGRGEGRSAGIASI